MYELDPLPYAYNALEPHISSTTLNIHYNKHQRGYLNKLNELLSKINYKSNYTLEELIINIDEFPLEYRDDVLYNASGVINHNLYWNSMNSSAILPSGKLMNKINNTYGSYDNFKTNFINSAKTLVGSGYTFLVLNKNKDLEIINTSNQDSPYTYGLIPLLTIDLWEHAYYLDYQNNKLDYINNFFSIINFNTASKIYESNI